MCRSASAVSDRDDAESDTDHRSHSDDDRCRRRERAERHHRQRRVGQRQRDSDQDQFGSGVEVRTLPYLAALCVRQAWKRIGKSSQPRDVRKPARRCRQTEQRPEQEHCRELKRLVGGHGVDGVSYTVMTLTTAGLVAALATVVLAGVASNIANDSLTATIPREAI